MNCQDQKRMNKGTSQRLKPFVLRERINRRFLTHSNILAFFQIIALCLLLVCGLQHEKKTKDTLSLLFDFVK
jgi:hypothetical protein